MFKCLLSHDLHPHIQSDARIELQQVVSIMSLYIRIFIKLCDWLLNKTTITPNEMSIYDASILCMKTHPNGENNLLLWKQKGF